MTNYKDAIIASLKKIEGLFTADDLNAVTRKEMAGVLLEINDILTDAVVDWWERDEEGERYMKMRVLDSFEQ